MPHEHNMTIGDAKRIAVIAIHGVGDHQPEEMAKAVGAMLQTRQEPGGADRYSALKQKVIGVRIEPVEVSDDCPITTGKKVWGPLDALRLAGHKVAPATATLRNSIDHVFMEGQLSGYVSLGPEDSCEFLRIEGTRKADTEVPEKEVHIYDMFWSDLSGVGKSGLRIFGELYQILFHLGSIGINNVAAAAAFFRHESRVARQWDNFSRAQKFAAGMIAFPIPLLNLILVAIAVALFAGGALSGLTPAEQGMTGGIAAVAVIAGAWMYLLRQRESVSGVRFRAPLIFLFLGAGTVIGGVAVSEHLPGGLPPQTPEVAQSVVAAVLLGVALFVVSVVVSAYEKRRPGAREAYNGILAVTFVSAVVSIVFVAPWNSHYVALACLMRAAEVSFWWLVISWGVFWLGMIWSLVSGKLAVRAVELCPGTSTEGDRARRTNWTARLTIGLSAAVFLLVTFAAWAGLLNVGLRLLPRDSAFNSGNTGWCHAIPVDCTKPIETFFYSPLIVRRDRIEPARNWADESFYDAGIGFIPVMLVLTVIAAAITLYAVGPSVLDELSPPTEAEAVEAEGLGNWLTAGFRFMRVAGQCLYVGVFLFPVAVAVILNLTRLQLVHYAAAANPFAETLGALVGGTAVGILAFAGRLSKLALGFRTAVRVGLDVDNWLREHPRGTNPTARICARYVSLLRHIASARNANGESSYDALVIFAHSQGTVITADLLRFLHVESEASPTYDPALVRLKSMNVYLFTVGCPLRQLYGLRFPYLYGYAEDTGSGPAPEDLGVTCWTNAYRTGDYVGRFLWRPNNPWVPASPISEGSWNPPVSVPANVFISGNRIDFAIGSGAHTHYWDKTGDQIANTLDAIIARASARSR
jgi:hypothetical protein